MVSTAPSTAWGATSCLPAANSGWSMTHWFAVQSLRKPPVFWYRRPEEDMAPSSSDKMLRSMHRWAITWLVNLFGRSSRSAPLLAKTWECSPIDWLTACSNREPLITKGQPQLIKSKINGDNRVIECGETCRASAIHVGPKRSSKFLIGGANNHTSKLDL